MKIKVTVTEDHIESGEPLSETMCPIALALAEKCKDGTRIQVGAQEVTFDFPPSNRDRYRFSNRPLPEVAETFVRKFDHGVIVDPIEFEMSVPPSVLK